MLYDALKMWALGVNSSLGPNNAVRSGRAITDEIMKVKFQGELITELYELLWLFDSQKADAC